MGRSASWRHTERRSPTRSSDSACALSLWSILSRRISAATIRNNFASGDVRLDDRRSDADPDALEEGTSIDAAIAYRDGLLLALLVHRPLRRANLAAIRVDQHLIRTNSGYRLQFGASEMKSHRPYSCSVPRQLDKPLRRYLSEFRPRLVARDAEGLDSGHLWLASTGRPLVPAGVAAIIRRQTAREFGVGMGPHLMRHIIATAVAEHSPNRVGDVAVILGHQSYETSERHYVHAGAAQSVRALDEALNVIATRSRAR